MRERGTLDATERTVPYDTDAEEAVLGALLLDPQAVNRVSTFLTAGDFYRERNGWVYEAVIALTDSARPVDVVTLGNELSRRDRLEATGGLGYLSHLVSVVPTALHVEHYAEIVHRCALMRRLIAIGGQIAALGYQAGPDVDATLGRAEDMLYSLRREGAVRGFVHIREVLDQYLEESVRAADEEKPELESVKTGFVDIDRLLGGLQRSDLVILAARPSLGKSSLALNVAHHAALRQKATVAIFSLEMSREQVAQRLLCSQAGVDSQRVRMGFQDLSRAEQDRINEAVGVLANTSIYIDDTPLIRVSELRAKAKRLHAEVGVDLVVVDYLQLIAGNTPDNRVQEISEISRSLKGLAREINVPVLALSQLSRAVEGRTPHVPMLSDLRDSGCLPGDTLVYLPDEGTYRRIDELVGRSDFNVLALNSETWRTESRPVLHAFATGHKPVFRMATRLGRSIRATANHQFLTIDGWRRLDELAVGVRIALPRRLPGPAQPTMSDEELALLGHLIGDGCTLPRYPVHYTTSDPSLAQIVADLAVKIFGNAITPRINPERDWYQVYLAAGYHLTHAVRNPIAAWLDSMGVFGLRSWEKRVPERVFAQPNERIACFLRHLWATDGCVQLSHGVKHYAAVYYATSSSELARNVQSLLLRLGINAILSRHSQGRKGRDQYHVIVSGKPEIETFFASVGALGESKVAHQAAIADYLARRTANTNRDILPSVLWRRVVVPAQQAVGLTSREMQAGIGAPYCGTSLYRQNMSRERASRVARVVRSDALTRLAESDVYWDEIVSIEPDGEEDVYDLTVDGLHNFVANDVIVHNSIEQDADIVMFIYREDVYFTEEQWERQNTGRPYPKGIATIIVGKHRNGPTGQVSLIFFERTTKFADLQLNRE